MSIWNYSQINKLIPKEKQLSLNEGNTPLSEIIIKKNKLLIKREDKNPNGSFKDRSLAYQISHFFQKGATHLTISSSGNAAISAANYCKLANIKLEIFISTKISIEKKIILEKLKSNQITIHESKKAKSDAIKYAKQNKIPNLRGSVDKHAITGFKTIAYELYEQNKNIDAIFIPCSSGTSTIGIYNGYQDLFKDNNQIKIPAFHIVQTERIHSFAKIFDKDFTKSTVSLANAISDRVGNRKEDVLKIINETNGFGWVISDFEIQKALKSTKSLINNKSPNSHLSLSGFSKSKECGYNYNHPCLIFSGL